MVFVSLVLAFALAFMFISTRKYRVGTACEPLRIAADKLFCPRCGEPWWPPGTRKCRECGQAVYDDLWPEPGKTIVPTTGSFYYKGANIRFVEGTIRHEHSD
jgi:hypothetical protein